MASAQQLEAAWAELLAAYPDARVSPDTARVYAKHLSHLSGPALEHAVTTCTRTCKRFPTVAELLEAAPVTLRSVGVYHE